ncbi:MAG TPA: YafY family protein [Bacillales bacterium]|nr:YafY family protein [Bacillales bacterium]
MSRLGRLFELMITLNTKERFTVQELADDFSVSRRTMLRDLHLLSEMGMPLESTTGPYGGYRLIRSQSLPSISLTPEEAVGLIISYEAYQHFPGGPFEDENVSTLTKVRSSLSDDMIRKVERLRGRIAIDAPPRSFQVPFLKEMLQASLDQVHLEIDYESRSKRSTRVIYPYGLFLANGLWYVPSYCYLREMIVTFRADRMIKMKRVENEERTPPDPDMTVRELLDRGEDQTGRRVPLLAKFTRLGCKLADPDPGIGELLKVATDGTGIVDTKINEENLSWYARYFLGLGKEVKVEKPRQLVDMITEMAEEVRGMYR